MNCHCNQCGHDWEPKSTTRGNPASCPRCKRYDWNEPKKGGGSGENRDKTVRGLHDDNNPDTGKPYRGIAVDRHRGSVRDQPRLNGEAFVDVPEGREDAPVKICKNPECGRALGQKNGFWYCPDLTGCALGGKQQGKVSTGS